MRLQQASPDVDRIREIEIKGTLVKTGTPVFQQNNSIYLAVRRQRDTMTLEDLGNIGDFLGGIGG